MTLKNLTEAEAALAPYIPLTAQLTGKNISLERMWPLLGVLGNPQRELRVVHIAGTSGKTSTAYYMAALLSATGAKTGLGVSPHIDSITERVQINGVPLSEAEFCQALGEFLTIVRTANQQPSHFELLQAFTFWVFAKQGVEYAVIETGMGGLHDASNVAQRPDKLCIITDIGLDHTHILGNTIEQIAAQKAGIIHEGNTVIMYEQAPAVMAAIQERLVAVKGTLQLATRHTLQSQIAAYQQRNWGLAYEAFNYLAQRDGLPQLSAQALQATQVVYIPGRMDVIQIDDKTIVMDGAHNVQKMTAFVESFQQLYPGIRPAVLMGMKDGNDYEDVVACIAPLANRVVTTAFATTQDLPVVSVSPQKLAAAFRKQDIESEACDDQVEAVRHLLDGPETICVITGSFYMLGQLRPQLKAT